MPTWGLSSEQRKTIPWGLSEDLLAPAKQNTDPVHGDIYLTKLEVAIVDSPAMQRLRRLRQLGTTHLVYPGATHTRFAHSLGTLRVAQDLMDALLAHRSGPNPEKDLFAVWQSESLPEFEKKVAEAVVLARLGGLMHDMCHVAYGHTLEDDLGLLTRHDDNMDRFNKCWGQLGPIGDKLEPIKAELMPLIISKTEHETELKYRFVQDVVGNTICADLLDYLARDHQFTGLRMEYGDRFLSSLYVTPPDAPYYGGRVCVRLRHRNRVRVDIETELFKLLRYRYELTERVLTHHAKLAADSMLGKMFAALHSTEQPLEELAFDHGDDGLLEHVYDREDIVTYREAARMAKMLLSRQLYKRLCTVGVDLCDPAAVYEKFGTATKRREVESEAARYMGEPPDRVALWLFHPDMRLKVAGVLVDLDGQIRPLADHDASALRQGREIIEGHKRLWQLSVFVHPDLRENPTKCAVLTAYLSQLLGVNWDGVGKRSTEQLEEDAIAEEFDLKPSERGGLTAAAWGQSAPKTHEARLGILRVAAKAILDVKDAE